MFERKNHALDDGDTARRARRGWGPFTGGQLTVIVVAALLAVGLPVGAYAAVSGSNVFVTDDTTGKHAKVDASGKLLTADQHLRTGALGVLKVAPQYGNVTARSASPAETVIQGPSQLSNVSQTIAASPSDATLVITSIHVSVSVANGARALVEIKRTVPGGSCDGTSQTLELAFEDESGVVVLPYDPGLVLQPDQGLCASFNVFVGSGTSDEFVFTTANGYLVPN